MRFIFACLAATVAIGCDSTNVVVDAGPDTALHDANTIDAWHEDTSSCTMACPLGQTCCYDNNGVAHCADLNNDITNCGVCNRDCVASRRGDSCVNAQCGCGDFEIGCTGAENSICCPGISGARAYCANPGLDLSDCGGCNMPCDGARSSLCSGGICFCGNTGGACAGTIDDLCCADPSGDSTCVDARTSQAHCGMCGNRCSAFEHCVDQECVSTLDGSDVDGGT